MVVVTGCAAAPTMRWWWSDGGGHDGSRRASRRTEPRGDDCGGDGGRRPCDCGEAVAMIGRHRGCGVQRMRCSWLWRWWTVEVDCRRCVCGLQRGRWGRFIRS